MAQPIYNWAEFKKVLKQLKDPRAKEMYYTITLDTVDIAFDYCVKYICDNYKKADGTIGVDSIADIPYGGGYSLVGKEFDECLRSIVMMDYGIILISHGQDKSFKDQNGEEFQKIVPTLEKRANNIVSRMSDIIGYARVVTDKNGVMSTKLFLRGTPRFEAGSRFKYTPDYIDFSYENLVNAISEAIDKQAKEDGEQFFTEEKINLYKNENTEFDFDTLMKNVTETINQLIANNPENLFVEYYQPRIVQITDKYLGRGQKINQCSREQSEALSLIYDDLIELSKQKPE